MRVIVEVLSLLPDADEFSDADMPGIAYRGHLQLNGHQLQLFDGATSTAITPETDRFTAELLAGNVEGYFQLGACTLVVLRCDHDQAVDRCEPVGPPLSRTALVC